MQTALHQSEVDVTVTGEMPESANLNVGSSTLKNLSASIGVTIQTTLQSSDIREETVLPFMDLKVCKRLGSGGMGTVYLAQNNDGLFAVKVMDPRGDKTSITRAAREFYLVQKAYSQGIRCVPEPHTYSLLENSSQTLHCIVTEYIPGKDVNALIADDGALPPMSALWFARKAAEGLHAIHEAKMVHRDIKPANIMVGAESPEKEDVVFMDFGLVRGVDERTVTQDNSFCGTLPYLAPEVFINGGKSNSPACDVYALGITFYETLVGKRPLSFTNPLEYFAFFQSGGLKQIIKMEDCPTSEDPREREFIRGLFNLIVEMTHPKSERRFTAQQVHEALSSMVQLPDTEEAKLILPHTIDHRTEQHSKETVRERMARSASQMSFGTVPDTLRGFDDSRTMEFTIESESQIHIGVNETRSRISSLMKIGGTIAGAGIFLAAAALWSGAKKEVSVSASHIPATPVLTPVAPVAPNVVETAKLPKAPTFIRDDTGKIIAVEFGLNSENPVRKDVTEALVFSNGSDRAQDGCFVFLCDPTEAVGAAKLLYKDKDDLPPAESDKMKALLCFPTEDGGCLFYYPGIGIEFVNAEGETMVFTQKEILAKKHLESPKMVALLSTIHLGEATQHISMETLERHGWQRISPGDLAKNIPLQVVSLLPKKTEGESGEIHPVSNTSKE